METYQNLCTEYYDLDKPNAPEEALQFYLEYIKKAQGPILEPMCGSGRYLIPFLEAGFNIEGLDASLHMMKACLRKCADKQLKPVIYPQFLHEMSIDKKYAFIFIPNGSLGLITDKKIVQICLKNLYNHLLPGGTLVFEVDTIYAIPKQSGLWHGQLRRKINNTQILLSTLPFYEETTQTLNTLCRYELIQDNRVVSTEIENLGVRLYKHEEMDNMLEDIGFKEIHHLKPYTRAESGDKDETMIYECKRVS